MSPMTDEIKAQIAEIDFKVANLILKNQGNYLAIWELAETLSDCWDSCEMNLHCIRIVGDGEEPVRAIGKASLPEKEKDLIFSTAITSTVAIKILAGTFGCDFETAASDVEKISQL